MVAIKKGGKIMEYLIAVDLEGVHGVVGEAYKGLSSDMPDYQKAVENAHLEINAAAKALFESGAKTVVVWDNHGSGVNLKKECLDSRVILWQKIPERRMAFCKEFNFKAILFIGYHAKAGEQNGVLAHTFNSTKIQYIKINGKQVGEYTIDSFVASLYSLTPIFASSDDTSLKEIKELVPNIETVTTKKALGRNTAEFIEKDVVLNNIYNGVKTALTKEIKPIFAPENLKTEMRYTRMEDAEIFLKKAVKMGLNVKYGEDAHTIIFNTEKIDDIPLLV